MGAPLAWLSVEVSLPRAGVWTDALDFLPHGQAADACEELEELGCGVLWLPEVAGRDPLVALALLLPATRAMVGATGVANIWGRDAVTMTEGARALEEAFAGRFVLGLGVSHRSLVEDLRGHSWERPLTAMRDYLDGMDRSPYTGERPATPLRRVVAALGPRMLALAAERAEGALTYLVTPEHTESARRALGGDRLLCVEQAVVLESDPEVARETARRYLAAYLTHASYRANLTRLGFTEDDMAPPGSDRLVDGLVAWGGVEVLMARVGEHYAAGADHVCVQALRSERRRAPLSEWQVLVPAVAEVAAAIR